MNTFSPNHQKRYLELDALRGIAALFVVLFHYSLHYKELPVFSIFRFGITGVDLFFLISGFVIFQSISAVKSGTEFLINRLTRLYPTYWVAVTFTFFVIFFTNRVVLGYNYSPQWGDYWCNMTMFQYYIGVDDLDGPYWTMITEMVFYLIMFVLLVTRLIRFTIPLFILMLASTVIVSWFYKDSGGEFYWDYKFNFPLSQYLPLFFGGIAFYKITVEKTRQWRYYLLIVICYLTQYMFYEYVGRLNGFISHAEYKLILAIYFTLFFLFAFGKLKWLVNPVTVFLGKISFPLYLIHQFFSINFMIPKLMKIGVNYYVAAYLVALPICILVASFITFTVERR